MAKDPRFQALKEFYKDKHYSDDHLAQALQLCREYHDYDIDWFPETPAQRGVFTRFMNHYLANVRLAKTESDLGRDSLYNLYTTLYALYTPEQLDNRISMLSHDFRSVLDKIEQRSKRKMTRQELIEAQSEGNKNGYVKIMEHVFNIYKNEYTDVDKMMERFDKKNPTATESQREAARKKFEYRAQEYKTILANKERLSALAATRIGAEEGFVVNVKDFTINFEAPSEEDYLSDGVQDTPENNGDDKEEGSKGDRYGDYRTLHLMNTLSVRARRLVSGIEKVDSSGKIIRDDLGAKQYIDGRQVASVLKRVLVNSTPDSLMSDLESAADFYPWMKGLINKLNDDPDAKKTVYANFKNAETTYVYVNLENGKYVPRIANSRSAGNALMREAGSNLQAGYILDEESSIYTGYGSLVSEEKIDKLANDFQETVNKVKKFTATIRMVDGDKAYYQKRVEELISEIKEKYNQDADYLRLSGPEAMKGFLDANPDVSETIAKALRGQGFAVKAQDIRTIALQTMNKKSFGFLAGRGQANESYGRNKLYRLVGYISGVYGRAQQIYKTYNNSHTGALTGQYLFNTSESFKYINRALALAQYKDVEARVVSEGKSLSTYNNVNLLHQTFDLLTNKRLNSEEDYRQDIEDEYLQYEGMALGSGEHRRVSGWLRSLLDNEDDIRGHMRVLDISAFNHVEYADLSRGQKLTNSLIMFLEGSKISGSDSFTAYEVPIQADYSTAYNFITAPRMTDDEIINNLTDEVLMELERIAAIDARQNDPNRIELKVYEKQGLKFQIFPEFNDNGFKQQYSEIRNPEEAENFVREQVRLQLEKVVDKDFNTITDSGILTNSAFRNVDFGYGNYDSLYVESGNVSDLGEDARDVLRRYALNVYYARQQMTKLLVGGTEQFNGLIDFEKRNMLTHATRSSLDTNATWNGKRVGKETQNVVYVEDDESASAFLSSIKEMLQNLLDEKVINRQQFDTMLESYTNIKTTDGQGFRTLDSYRAVQIMTDSWDEQHETAYKNIKAGKPTREDINTFMQNIKPVLTGYETVPAALGENQKPVKLTVLHKYSEAVLLPMELSKYCLQNKAIPLQAFEKAQERLAKQGKEIDMFLFHSGVKVGAHSIISPFYKKNGNRAINTEKEIEDYIVDRVSGKESVTHTLPFKYYGIAASTPAHAADDRIAWASQAEKVAWANILKGQKITVRGKEVDAWDARELYFGIKTANIVEAYTKIRKFFTNTDELEKVFQEELAEKQYSSREMKYALAHLKDGSFAIPLFSPNIEHQVQELLSSIIKKRLTKPKVKGANILQTTSLGMDIEASAFDDSNALSEEDKLEVVFEGSRKNKRIKYVEVYMPIHDSRLKIFADKEGNIGPDRLRQLVEDGIIPESMLEFIAYRTPSDAEHSVIPCRIKGFVANTGGATIRMPKEIMVMTGHDYDGDKMRCHFKDFRLVDKSGDEVNLSDTELVQMMLGQKAVNPSWKKCEVYEYDYDKSPLENSQKARDNARVELMFSELTSPAGSQRMVIPGGCDETKVIAKSLYIIRATRDEDVKNKLSQILGSRIGKTNELYDTLVSKSDSDLTDIIREIGGLETPFSVTHSADAFDYIMGGAQMIGIYATYNSALQMLQRLNMNYVPKLTRDGRPYVVNILNNTFDKLFTVNNHNGRLASLGLARLLNAAVDNNKDPVLGYLNQTKEMAEMTFLMFSVGMEEEDIHLIMNQPAVIELINRLKSRNSKGLKNEASDIIQELSQSNEYLSGVSDPYKGPWIALKNVSAMSKDDFTSVLDNDFNDLKESKDLDFIQNQISILQTLVHLNPAAENLATFVRLTRPESESGAIGTSVADIIAKEAELNKFRTKLEKNKDSDIRISGMREVLAPRDVHEGWDTSYISEILGSKLPEVVALNSLMMDTSLEMFKPFFPQAKQSWTDLATEIANQYSYRKTQEGTVAKIGQEMILWKLLSNSKFVQGDPQEEQRRIIIDVPKQVKDLKQRIANAEKNPGTDPAAEELIGNAFIDKLTATSPEDSNGAPRLQFYLNGAAVEGTRDLISASWGAMLASNDESIRNLATDLFKYNMYTNGFSYGMYEFAHFAPFSILMSTPGYIEALQDILKNDWNNDAEKENFINQYYMNHWGDKKFLSKIPAASLSFLPGVESGKLLLSTSGNDSDLIERINGMRYIILTSGEKNSVQTLYRVEHDNSDAAVTLVKAQKLGVRNRNQQVTLQYNPTVDYHYVTPVVAGNESAWGQLDNLNVWAQANINAPGMRTENAAFGIPAVANPMGLGFFGLEPVAKQLETVESKAESADKSNDGALQSIPMTAEDAPVLPVNDAFAGMFSGDVDLEALRGAAIGTVSEEDENKMFSIVRRGEDGKITTEKVPATPNNIREARKQKAFVELNKRLREILREKGIGVGVLSNAEARMSLGGVADFDTANVTAEGLLEMIRVAEGYEGEIALPEEFAHVALEMLGHDNPLVQRLLNALRSSRESMQEAYDGMYDEYEKQYGADNMDKLVLEAAGKLVAKKLLREQEIQSSPVKRLVSRIVDAIKSLFRRFSRNEIQNAIFDANQIASKVAREMLGGKLADQMDMENITASDTFLQLKKNLTGKNDILSKLLMTENKRLSILKKRIGYANKNTKSKAVEATEIQIAKLESAIRNYKTEDAIITYLNDSLGFLEATNKSLDDAVNSGRPMNSVCRKLNAVRDTLYSFATSIEDIREAISNNEIQDNSGLTATLDQVSGVLAKFFDKYNNLARHYFEEMLSSVYGEHGKTITIGRQKGRTISIHEMATKADHDISLMSSWFYSIADCNDYVLKAVDDIARNAKIRARRRASDARPKIEKAMADLIRETGSRDQSFMFEYERGADGKMHKTGKYISEEASKSLTAPQKKFYDVMMAIKHEADTCVPSSLIRDANQIVMVRKYTMDRFKDAEGAKGKALEAWDGLKNRVMDMSDNFDPEYHEVAVDFQGNKVDMLPVKFVMKGKNESYDVMTDDVAASVMAYAGMAYEYNEMANVVNTLENAKYMAAERDVIQKTGRRTQRESIETDTAEFNRPFTKKAAGLHAQKALEDFFSMHIYGHTAANEGTFGNTRISKRKTVDTINNIVSLSQMALNIPQRIANVATGATQVVIESAGRGVFNVKDVTWASNLWMKETGFGSDGQPARLVELGKTESGNKLSLWNEYFDVHQNNGRDVPKYGKGWVARNINQSLLYGGLTAGEDYLASIASLAAARNFKVKNAQGKTETLWDAYEVKYLDPVNKTGAHLELKQGYTKADGSPITFEDEQKFMKQVIGLNFDMQGIYNLDDRSAIQQYAFGALIIMYRKWIAPAIKRRYGATQYNALKGADEEGYHVTLFRTLYDSLVDAKDAVTEENGAAALWNIISDAKAMISAYRINTSKMNPYELSNLKRAWTELGIVLGLFLSTALLLRLPPDDHDGNEFLTWADNFAMSQLLRLRAEIGAQAPTPMFVQEGLRILKSPFAAIGPIKSTLNVFQLMLPHNYFVEIKSGRYKGHKKAYKYFREFPIISMFKKIDNFVDPSPLIQYYKNDVSF